MPKHKKPVQDHTSGVASEQTFTMRPIAIAHTPYRERYGTPRQASVLEESREADVVLAEIRLNNELPVASLAGLEGFDRIWVVYVFHLNDGYATTVRPPRDPSRPQGIFATRAPHRPNSIGLSCLAIERIEGRSIFVRGIDLLDQTPILDIKPYVVYADAFPDARQGWLATSSAASAERG